MWIFSECSYPIFDSTKGTTVLSVLSSAGGTELIWFEEVDRDYIVYEIELIILKCQIHSRCLSLYFIYLFCMDFGGGGGGATEGMA